MSTHVPKMDVYGDYRTPFLVAVYCRSNRYSVSAVSLTSALRNEDMADIALKRAQLAYDAAKEERVRLIRSIEMLPGNI